MFRTWELVASQPESVSNNLLVDSALDLKQDLADCHSCGPVVERTLSFTHSHLIQHLVCRSPLERFVKKKPVPRYR